MSRRFAIAVAFALALQACACVVFFGAFLGWRWLLLLATKDAAIALLGAVVLSPLTLGLIGVCVWLEFRPDVERWNSRKRL